MTRAEIINDLKNMIGPAGKSVEVDGGGLAVWVNEAYSLVLDAINERQPEFFTKTATTSMVTNQQEYSLPPDFEKMIMANIKYDASWVKITPLMNINQIHAHANTESTQGYNVAQPFYYLSGDNIGIMPIPTAEGDNNLKIWYTYTPAELGDTSTPDFPRRFHYILKYWAYASYLDQDDNHVAAERMRQRFEAMVDKLCDSLSQRDVNEPRSVLITNSPELYI